VGERKMNKSHEYHMHREKEMMNEARMHVKNEGENDIKCLWDIITNACEVVTSPGNHAGKSQDGDESKGIKRALWGTWC
jgi:hypothetical protein